MFIHRLSHMPLIQPIPDYNNYNVITVYLPKNTCMHAVTPHLNNLPKIQLNFRNMLYRIIVLVRALRYLQQRLQARMRMCGFQSTCFRLKIFSFHQPSLEIYL